MICGDNSRREACETWVSDTAMAKRQARESDKCFTLVGSKGAARLFSLLVFDSEMWRERLSP